MTCCLFESINFAHAQLTLRTFLLPTSIHLRCRPPRTSCTGNQHTRINASVNPARPVFVLPNVKRTLRVPVGWRMDYCEFLIKVCCSVHRTMRAAYLGRRASPGGFRTPQQPRVPFGQAPRPDVELYLGGWRLDPTTLATVRKSTGCFDISKLAGLFPHLSPFAVCCSAPFFSPFPAPPIPSTILNHIRLAGVGQRQIKTFNLS